MIRLFLGSLLAVFVSVSSVSIADNEPWVKSVRIDKAYLVKGFDSDDVTQVVVTGTFPNTCYHVGTPDVWVNYRKKRIELTELAYFYDKDCIDMKVAFVDTINLGIVDAGNYDVVDMKSNRKLGKITVASQEEGGVGTDDYLYAPIHDVYIDQLRSRRPRLTIRGEYLNSCMKLTDVKIDYQNEVIVVQPMMEKKSATCKTGVFPYKKVIRLNKKYRKKFLLHVRSLNGRSINKIYSP